MSAVLLLYNSIEQMKNSRWDSVLVVKQRSRKKEMYEMPMVPFGLGFKFALKKELCVAWMKCFGAVQFNQRNSSVGKKSLINVILIEEDMFSIFEPLALGASVFECV